jgi:hypothetical protein
VKEAKKRRDQAGEVEALAADRGPKGHTDAEPSDRSGALGGCREIRLCVPKSMIDEIVDVNKTSEEPSQRAKSRETMNHDEDRKVMST